jgi:hypothetical protein
VTKCAEGEAEMLLWDQSAALQAQRGVMMDRLCEAVRAACLPWAAEATQDARESFEAQECCRG